MERLPTTFANAFASAEYVGAISPKTRQLASMDTDQRVVQALSGTVPSFYPLIRRSKKVARLLGWTQILVVFFLIALKKQKSKSTKKRSILQEKTGPEVEFCHLNQPTPGCCGGRWPVVACRSARRRSGRTLSWRGADRIRPGGGWKGNEGTLLCTCIHNMYI